MYDGLPDGLRSARHHTDESVLSQSGQLRRARYVLNGDIYQFSICSIGTEVRGGIHIVSESYLTVLLPIPRFGMFMKGQPTCHATQDRKNGKMSYYSSREPEPIESEYTLDS